MDTKDTKDTMDTDGIRISKIPITSDDTKAIMETHANSDTNDIRDTK